MHRGLFILLTLAGCSIGTAKYPLVPDEKITVAAGQGGVVSTTQIAVAGAVYLFYDPLAPNWEIRETTLDEHRYLLQLEMKRFNTGGDGDALMIVRRRGEQLARQAGMKQYKIQSFSQHIDSQTVGARRQAEAYIVLMPEMAPPIPAMPPEIAPSVVVSPKKTVSKKSIKPVVTLKKNSVEASVSATASAGTGTEGN